MGNTNSASIGREFKDISNVAKTKETFKENAWLDFVITSLSKRAAEYYWAGMLADTIKRLVAVKPFQWHNAAKAKAHIRAKAQAAGTAHYVKEDLNSPINCVGVIIELFRKDFLFDSSQAEPIEGIKMFMQIMVETICLFYGIKGKEMRQEVTCYLMERLIQRGILKFLYERKEAQAQNLQRGLRIAASNPEILETYRLKAIKALSAIAKNGQIIDVEFTGTKNVLTSICKSEDIFVKAKQLENLSKAIQEDIKRGLELKDESKCKVRETQVVPYVILSVEMNELVAWIEVLSEFQNVLQNNSKFISAVQIIKKSIFSISKLTLQP
eukprot:TRINITY_DN2913_c0_g1_i1.p1 TRINITY_DN2913_c0_g1~~TRINITY_DN2913_c0_g1_i1.p1  ORF type:complete len:326 (+),score=84.09 TRINITY_DN2913_c0_g1_i1:228-1205(+)